MLPTDTLRLRCVGACRTSRGRGIDVERCGSFSTRPSRPQPQLWSTILTVLERSRTLILLACPESAGSQWVGMEARWWLQNRSSRQLLIVLSDGEIEWDPAARDFDWSRTTALPRELAGAFEEEPLYLDMRWTREADLALSRDPRLQEALAQLYAAITGRGQGRTDRRGPAAAPPDASNAWGAAAMLGAAALAAIVAAGLFLQQRDLARERELEARHHFYAAQLKAGADCRSVG